MERLTGISCIDIAVGDDPERVAAAMSAVRHRSGGTHAGVRALGFSRCLYELELDAEVAGPSCLYVAGPMEVYDEAAATRKHKSFC